MDRSQVLAAFRFAAWALMAAKAMLAGYIWRSCRMDMSIGEQLPWYDASRSNIFAGMTLMPAGWAVHQIYWWIHELATVRGDADVAAIMERNAIYTVVVYCVIFYGCILIFSGWLRHVFDGYWLAVGVGFVVALVFLGAIYAR